MYGVEYGYELEFARGYIHIFPRGFNGNLEPELVFSAQCPQDIRERVQAMWPDLKKETERRHAGGI